ncbi:hypothetical protein [Loktanella salsilacus]|uniref:hypothetical protein n=1 Tax=Loktanella salsilacus TaxID=195913 RepID=UPI0037357416
MKSFIVAAALLIGASPAFAKDATCELVLYGRTIMNGPCDFSPNGRDGSFVVTDQNGYFAYALKDGDEMKGYWNGYAKASHAHDDLGNLRRGRDRACWENDTARLCAW